MVVDESDPAPRRSIASGVAASRRLSPRAGPGQASERRAALAAALHQELLRRLGDQDERSGAALLLQSRIDAESCLDAPTPDQTDLAATPADTDPAECFGGGLSQEMDMKWDRYEAGPLPDSASVRRTLLGSLVAALVVAVAALLTDETSLDLRQAAAPPAATVSGAP